MFRFYYDSLFVESIGRLMESDWGEVGERTPPAGEDEDHSGLDSLIAIQFAAGIALLIAGAEILVRGASRLARRRVRA